MVAADGVNSRVRDALRRRFRARRRPARQQVRLARHVAGVRRLHLRLRGDRARRLSGRMPTGSTSDCSTFIVECDEATWRGRVRPAWTRTKRSPPARSCSPNSSTATRCITNAAHLRGSRVAQLSARANASTGATTTSSWSATPRTPRTSRSGREPSSRWRTRSRSPTVPQPAGDCELDAALFEYQEERSPEVLRCRTPRETRWSGSRTFERYIHFEPRSSPTGC